MKNSFRKTSIVKMLLGLICFALVSGNAVFAKAAPATPEQAAMAFFRWYIGEIAKNRDPRTQQKAKIRAFVTKNFAKKLYSIPADEYDADVFIAAQDFDEEWARAIKVSKATIKGNVATFTVTLGVYENGKTVKSKWKHNLRLRMVKEDGAWKIDRINDF